MSCSSALIQAHIIKNNFNTTYCSFMFYCYRYTVPQIDSYCTCAGDVRSKSTCMSFPDAQYKPSVPQLAVQGCVCGGDWQGLYNATTHKEFCSCVNNIYVVVTLRHANYSTGQDVHVSSCVSLYQHRKKQDFPHEVLYGTACVHVCRSEIKNDWYHTSRLSYSVTLRIV